MSLRFKWMLTILRKRMTRSAPLVEGLVKGRVGFARFWSPFEAPRVLWVPKVGAPDVLNSSFHLQGRTHQSQDFRHTTL